MTNTENSSQTDDMYEALDALSVKFNTSIADVIWCAAGETKHVQIMNEARETIERIAQMPISDSLIEDLLSDYAIDEDDEDDE